MSAGVLVIVGVNVGVQVGVSIGVNVGVAVSSAPRLYVSMSKPVRVMN